MSWNKSGDDRAKSYQVYKDLQKAYSDLQQRYDAIEAKLAAKDEALRLMSRELYQALDAPARVLAATVSAPVMPPQEVATPLPVPSTRVAEAQRSVSEVVQRGGASLGASGASLRELFDEAPEKKRKEG